jgi:hypothetical protein
MVFNATFNNISVISWRLVSLVEETRVPGENHRPAVSHWQTLSHNVVSSTSRLSWIRTHNVSGDRHWLQIVVKLTTIRSRPRRPLVQWDTTMYIIINRIECIMVSVLVSSAVVRGFELRSVKLDYKIGIWYFSAKNAALWSKNKDWLTRNQDNVSEWSDMSIRGPLFQWATSSTIKIN